MKLKGLKSCIFGLIGGLILLPSFSSSYEMVGSNMISLSTPDTVVLGNYVYVFNNNGNIATNDYGQFFYYHNSCAGYSCDYVYGWTNGKLYFAGFFGGSIQTQGYIDSLCVSTSGSNCTNFDDYSASDFYGSNLKITKILFGLPDSNSLTSSSSSAYPLRLCFYDASSHNYYCVQNNVFNTGYPATSISNLNGSLSFSSLNGIKDYSRGSSPFNSSLSDNSNVINPRESAQNIYDSYRKLGYSDTLCYGGFGINDLFSNTNSSLNGITIGGGASVFDLYNYYSGGAYSSGSLSFVDWYNDRDFEYGFFKEYHDSSEFQYYYGKPRGFAGLFMVKDYFFKGSNFDPAVLKSFCEFTISNDPFINKTQTPIDIISDTINENELNQLIGNIGVIIPGTGSALDLLLQDLVGSGYVSEDDYYSVIDKGYQAINSIEIPTTEYPGILPTYIVVAFLGFMLLYIFKH